MTVSAMVFGGPNFYYFDPDGSATASNASCVPAYAGKLRLTSGDGLPTGTATFTFNQPINASLHLGSIGKIMGSINSSEIVTLSHNGTPASLSPTVGQSCPATGLGTAPTVSGLTLTGVAQQNNNADGNYRYGDASGSVSNATSITIDLCRSDGGNASITFDASISPVVPPCVKPNAGTDQSPVCQGNTAITTATLAATAVAGGAWSQVGTNPAGAVVTTPTSATSGVTGLTPGVYNFIWAWIQV